MKQIKFVNRLNELSAIDEECKASDLIVIMGRRRVGKSTLIKEWARLRGARMAYTQAIEGSPALQLKQIWQDLREFLPVQVEPRSWEELFSLINTVQEKAMFVFDEFPYLAASDPSIESRFQRWIDNEKPSHLAVAILGSSQTLMQRIFLNAKAPLYMRARRVLRIAPLSYRHFCESVGFPTHRRASFESYAMVGGIPRYWQFISPSLSPVEIASELYFGPRPFLENENLRLLKDEDVDKVLTASVVNAIGSGAARPSEIASRLGVPQTNLGRALNALTETGLVAREIPFGLSPRDTKRTLYSLTDPYLLFHYRVFLPHRTRWDVYDNEIRERLIREHASIIFEHYLRGFYPAASRYFEKDMEFDSVHFTASDTVQVTEIKFRPLTLTEKQSICKECEMRFVQTKLYRSRPDLSFKFVTIDLDDGLQLLSSQS